MIKQPLAKYSQNSSSLIAKYNDTLLLYLPQEIVDKILKFVIMTSKHPIFGKNLLNPIRNYFHNEYIRNERYKVVEHFAKTKCYNMGCSFILPFKNGHEEELALRRKLLHFSLTNHAPYKNSSAELQAEISRIPLSKNAEYRGIKMFSHILVKKPSMDGNISIWGRPDSISYIGFLGCKGFRNAWSKEDLIEEYYKCSTLWYRSTYYTDEDTLYNLVVDSAEIEHTKTTKKKLMRKSKKAIVNMIMKITPLDEQTILNDIAGIINRKVRGLCDKFNFNFIMPDKKFYNEAGEVVGINNTTTPKMKCIDTF